MSDDKEKQDKTEYSVDDILAEYGSGKYRKPSKVVEFPGQGRTAPAESQPESAQQLPAEESAPAPLPEEPGSEKKFLSEIESVQPFDEGPELLISAPSRPLIGSQPEPSEPPKKDEPDPIPEIVPEGIGRTIGARLSALLRRADHYADHMYDEAEPDEETRKAEKYLPGVDREEDVQEDTPKKPPKPHRPAPKPEELPPDTPPAQLAARYRKGLAAQGRRLVVAALLAVFTLLVSLDLPFLSWTDLAQGFVSESLSAFQLRALVLTILLAAVGTLCYDVPVKALRQTTALRPGVEMVTTLALVFTLIDGLTAGRLEPREFPLPCSAVTAFGLIFALWGIHARRQGDRVSAKLASQVRAPYIVTLDENKWNAKSAYTKRSDAPVGFGSQLQADDGPQKAYRVAAPLLILGGVLCALMASVGQEVPGRFPWAASCCFTAASAWSALLIYGLPYKKLADRLNKVGAALAGWPGVSRCEQAGIIMTDLDLFPTGSINVVQVNVFGGAATERVVAYTASLLRVLNCGLTRPFHDLLRAQGAFYREVSGVVPHEGGVSGIIRNQEVLVGSASFMHMMEVPMPPGHNIRNAIFCAIDGQLCGLFPLNYVMSPAVKPALSALTRAGVSPVLATRDPVLVPALLEHKFKLPVDKLEFPPAERRLELSQREQDHDPTAVALLSREGLSAYCDAVLGGRRLRLASRWGLVFTLLGAALGLCVTFYLTSIAAFASLTTVNFMVFMTAWLVPELVIANWVDRY